MLHISYCLGFLFNETGDSVALIKKTHPDWMAGKYNGLGGEVISNETPHAGMVREFKQEAGVLVTEWHRFATLMGRSNVDYTVHCYSAFDSGLLSQVDTMTKEPVLTWTVRTVSQIHSSLVIPGVKWMIPMALSIHQGLDRAAEFAVTERY